jgi:hypothetical protein
MGAGANAMRSDLLAGAAGRRRWWSPAPSTRRLPHIICGELAELAGADDRQDGLKHVLVLLDRLGRAAVEPVRQPVPGGLPYGVVRVTGPGTIPWSSSLRSSRSLSKTAALVLPLTWRRSRRPSSAYLSVNSLRQSPGQWRWRSGSRHGPRCSKEIAPSPRRRRVAMATREARSGDNRW